MAALTQSDLEKLSKAELISFIKRGIFRIDMLTTIHPTEMTKFETPEYQQFLQLRGIPIGIREAARKYNVPSPTISRWVQRGLIATLGTGSRNKVFIDEADIAYCADIRSKNPGQGHWLFNPDGTPYIQK